MTPTTSLVYSIIWMTMSVLRYAGVFAVFAGVGLFGVYFIAGNGRSTNGAVPVSAWLGAGPRKGMKIAGIGVLLLLAAFVIGLFLPNGG